MSGSWRHVDGLGVSVDDGRTFADEISRVDQTEPVRAGVVGSLSRHLTQVSPFVGHKGRERTGSVVSGSGGQGEESEEG